MRNELAWLRRLSQFFVACAAAALPGEGAALGGGGVDGEGLLRV